MCSQLPTPAGWNHYVHSFANSLTVYQECFPARFEEIHFINQPWYIDAIFHIMKPFLEDDAKQKVWDSLFKILTWNHVYNLVYWFLFQIHLHGNNLALLYRHVQPDILPAELGGNQPPYHIQSWLTHMTGKSDTEARSNGPAAKPEPPCFK